MGTLDYGRSHRTSRARPLYRLLAGMICLFFALCLVYSGVGLFIFGDRTMVGLMLLAAPACYFSGRVLLVGRL